MNTLTEMLLRSVSRYDAAYVSSWRFEIWCKTGEKLTMAETPGDYITRYEQYYQLIKRHFPACAVGGPGFNMSGRQKDFSSYMRSFYKNGISFDFISLYGYIYKTADMNEETSPLGAAILSSNPDHIPDTLRKYKRILKQSGYGDTPVFLSEFGSVLNVNCYITDSLYQADFLIHNIPALYKEADSIASMGLTDSMPWPLPYTDLYYPATALFTNLGIPKPAFAAYQFLFRLGSEVLSRGDQHIVTCTSPGHYQLLLYHYVHFDESYCFHPMELVPPADTYEVLAKNDAMEVSFSLKMLPDEQYKCLKYTLSRQYGSLLDLLITTIKEHPGDADEYLSMFNHLSPEELTYYIRASVPKQEIYYEQVQQGLLLEAALSPCEIQFYEFHLQL